MLQIRSSKSFTNTSKRFSRRTRISLDTAKRNTRRLFPFVILITVVLLAYSLFSIRKTNCVLNNDTCPKEVQVIVNNLLGTNSLFVNQKELLSVIKGVYPIEKMTVGYKALGTLNVILTGNSPYIQVNVYLVNQLPVLTMDQAPSTSDSAGWWVKPTKELETYVSTKEVMGFNLWENGSMISVATTGANINYIFSEKPTPEVVTSIYKMINIVLKYLDVSKIYIVNKRSFLSRPSQPDIIVSVPFDEGSLVSALQSIDYLVTIKKDAKVIDFSYKNPIIR
jgi:hypothetical protein